MTHIPPASCRILLPAGTANGIFPSAWGTDGTMEDPERRDPILAFLADIWLHPLFWHVVIVLMGLAAAGLLF